MMYKIDLHMVQGKKVCICVFIYVCMYVYKHTQTCINTEGECACMNTHR